MIWKCRSLKIGPWIWSRNVRQSSFFSRHFSTKLNITYKLKFTAIFLLFRWTIDKGRKKCINLARQRQWQRLKFSGFSSSENTMQDSKFLYLIIKWIIQMTILKVRLASEEVRKNQTWTCFWSFWSIFSNIHRLPLNKLFYVWVAQPSPPDFKRLKLLFIN